MLFCLFRLWQVRLKQLQIQTSKMSSLSTLILLWPSQIPTHFLLDSSDVVLMTWSLSLTCRSIQKYDSPWNERKNVYMRHCAVAVTKIFRLNISVVRARYFQLRMQGSFFLMKETAEDINKGTFKALPHQILFIFDYLEYLTAQRTGFTAHLQQHQDVGFKNIILSVHWTNTAVPFDLLC